MKKIIEILNESKESGADSVSEYYSEEDAKKMVKYYETDPKAWPNVKKAIAKGKKVYVWYKIKPSY